MFIFLFGGNSNHSFVHQYLCFEDGKHGEGIGNFALHHHIESIGEGDFSDEEFFAVFGLCGAEGEFLSNVCYACFVAYAVGGVEVEYLSPFVGAYAGFFE